MHSIFLGFLACVIAGINNGNQSAPSDQFGQPEPSKKAVPEKSDQQPSLKRAEVPQKKSDDELKNKAQKQPRVAQEDLKEESLGPPPDNWKTFESASRARVKMPGVAQKQVQDAPGGIQIVMHTVSPDKNSVYAVGWSEGELPAERRALSTEKLLDDACDGALGNTPGAKEISRKSIKLGPYPGKKLVMHIPKGEGKLVLCGYLNEKTGRIYMTLVGGQGFDEDSKEVRWFLNSFEIIEGRQVEKKKEDK